MAPLLMAAIPSLIKLLPDVAGWFGGDKAEKMADEVLNIASSVTGISNKDEALAAINADPNIALEFQKTMMNNKYRLDEMFLADKQNARNMQIEALKQEDLFSKRFIYYFAIGWSIFAAAYMTAITFMEIPENSVRFSDTILGFLLGTIISALFQFFFGSSKGSSDKNKSHEDLISLVKDSINKDKVGKQ